MKTEIIKAFVLSWTNEQVTCDCYELNEHRVFNKNPLFDGYKLFKGKNIWFKITIKSGEMIITNNESKSSWLLQKWNYYIKNKH